MAEIVLAGEETVLYKMNIEKEIYLRSQLEKWLRDARGGIERACERTKFSDFGFLCYQLLFHHGRELVEGWQQGIVDLRKHEEKFFALPKVVEEGKEYLDRVMDETGIIAYLGGLVYLSGFARKK